MSAGGDESKRADARGNRVRGAEQLKEAERLLESGALLPSVAATLNVKYHTLYARLRRYTMHKASAAERIATLEAANARLRDALVSLDLSAVVKTPKKPARKSKRHPDKHTRPKGGV